MHEKYKGAALQRERVTAVILGCSLYFKISIKVGWLLKFRCRVSSSMYLGKSRFFTILEKNWLKHLAISDSLETHSSFTTKAIFSLDF